MFYRNFCALRHNRLLNEYLFPRVIKRNAYKVVSRPDADKLKSPGSLGTEKVNLPALLKQKIKLSGPISVADYMKDVLTNSHSGYYMTKDVFGESGDFITSPELNQLFSEMVAIWFHTEWEKLGCPEDFQVVEFGPGRGSLIRDFLRILKIAGVEKNDFSIHLIEISPTLQKLQADTLCMTHKASESTPHYHEGETIRGTKVYWYRDIKNVPKKFSFYIANEFFDALPIHKFKKTEEGWREVLIDLDPTSSSSNDIDNVKFQYVLSREETTASKLYSKLSQNDQLKELEVCPQGIVIAKELATRIDQNGGIGLIVDYGHNGEKGDTFRAFKNHKQTDPLVDAGSADLTADVDFSLLKEAASEAKTVGPVTQRNFLLSQRIEIRLQVLLENSVKPEEREKLQNGYNMLIDKDKMGDCFKVMGIFPTINEEHYKIFPISGFVE